MTDADRHSVRARPREQPLPLRFDRRGRRIGVEEHVAAQRRHAVFARGGETHAGGRRVAVDEEQRLAPAQLVHEPAHAVGLLRQQAAHVVADADDERHGGEIGREHGGELGARLPDLKRAGAGILGAGQRLHRQMQHDLLALRVGLARERDRMRAERQHGHGHGARQAHGALAFGQAVADIVDDQGDFRRAGRQRRGRRPDRHEKQEVRDDPPDPTHHGVGGLHDRVVADELDGFEELRVVAQRDSAAGAAVLRVGVGVVDDDVGLYTQAVDRAPGRRQIARSRELDGRAFAERHHGLHGTFAVCRLADDARAVMILQRSGHDLGRRGRAAIHEHDRRHTFEQVAGVRELFEARLLHAARTAHYQAVGQELVRNADRRVEHAARVTAQIEHDAEQLVGAGAREQLAHGGVEIARSAVGERREPQVREAVPEIFAGDGLHLHGAARQREAQRHLRAVAHDVERHGRAGSAAHAGHGRADVFLVHRHVVDRHDDVARQDTGARRGRTVERVHDGDLAAVEVHVQADAGVVARTS